MIWVDEKSIIIQSCVSIIVFRTPSGWSNFGIVGDVLLCHRASERTLAHIWK